MATASPLAIKRLPFFFNFFLEVNKQCLYPAFFDSGFVSAGIYIVSIFPPKFTFDKA